MKKRVLSSIIFLTSLLALSGGVCCENTTQTIATTEDNTINLFFPARVGDEAVFDIDSNGNPTGYFGDLFRKVSQITSINVNFIIETDNDKITSDINKIRNYEGNVSYVGLDNADVEFDAITNVLTDEREEYPDFTFTVNSDCLSPVYLFTQDSNLTISEGETSSYEGKTIGLFSKAKTRNNLFYDFAKNIGLYDRDDMETAKSMLLLMIH